METIVDKNLRDGDIPVLYIHINFAREEILESIDWN